MVLCGAKHSLGNTRWCEGCGDSGKPALGKMSARELLNIRQYGLRHCSWMKGETGRSLQGEHACIGDNSEEQAEKRSQKRKQWGLEEQVLDVLGSGAATGFSSRYIVS